MINGVETTMEGIYLIENFLYEDIRGKFEKIFLQSSLTTKFCFNFVVKEIFYSFSGKDVIRGMHFQIPPKAQKKIIHVIKGSVLDVVLDLRKSSRTFGKFSTFRLSENLPLSLYVPEGFAHGFRALESPTVVLYISSEEYSEAHYAGIRWNSFGFDWGIAEPVVSPNDQMLPTFEEFCRINPF